VQVIQGEALAVLREMPDNSVDAIVSDPPAGINFMGRDWDNFSSRKKSNSQEEKLQSENDGKWLEGRGTSPYGFSHGGTATRAEREAFITFLTEIFTEARRVLKPGGHALVWSLPRTSHWTGYALEEAGFEIRDTVEHLYGSGFPKSLDVSKAIDKMAGKEREVIGPRIRLGDKKPYPYTESDYHTMGHNYADRPDITTPATPEAQQWAGFGSALKPAHETWWLCRKPLAEPTIAANVLKWGTGALNIDACRISTQDTLGRLNNPGANGWKNSSGGPTRATYDPIAASGRFPANLLLSHTLLCDESECVEGCPVLELDKQSGIRKSGGGMKLQAGRARVGSVYGEYKGPDHDDIREPNEGGASRYFAQFYYCPKPSRKERNAGCDELPEKKRNATAFDGAGGVPYRIGEDGKVTPKAISGPEGNHHPTVKSVALMSYLVRLITPPGGIVLDPFAGSGTTALAAIQEGCDFILIEREQEYVVIAEARIKHALAEIA
jgi:DNA modification methylase